MLYVTTRNNREAYTVQRILSEDRGPDGGLFVPFHEPCFTKEEADTLLNLPFDQCMAQVLNRLLGHTLTGWDVSFYTGRFPVRLKSLGYRMLIAEGWHNPEWNFSYLAESLASVLDSPYRQVPSDWLKIAVRVAVLAGICGLCRQNGMQGNVDIAVVTGDFSAPISAWYARNWGFPIGNIICCCNENGNLWDLIANGQMRTDGVSISTEIPLADIVIPPGLERLIYSCGGTDEVKRYQDACQQGRTYIPHDAVLAKLRSGIYVSVVSTQRMLEMIPRAYASRNYLLSPYDALCYCGLSDYRARFGETGDVLLFSERSPGLDAEALVKAMGLSEESLKQILS